MAADVDVSEPNEYGEVNIIIKFDDVNDTISNSKP